MSSSASDTIDCWLRPKDGGDIRTVRVTEPSDAMTLFGAGASLYFLSSSAMARDFIGAMNHCLGLGVAGRFPDGDVRGEIEVFASRAGHVTEWCVLALSLIRCGGKFHVHPVDCDSQAL